MAIDLCPSVVGWLSCFAAGIRSSHTNRRQLGGPGTTRWLRPLRDWPIVVPPRFDDGWVLTTVRQYADLGFFPTTTQSTRPLSRRDSGAWIERLWFHPGHTRIPAAAECSDPRGHVVAIAAPGPRPIAVGLPGRWAGVLIAAASAVGLQMTIRPEPVVALLLAAAIAVVVRYAQTGGTMAAGGPGWLSAMAMSVHQTGWSLALASLAVAPWLIPWLRRTWAYVAVLGVVVVSAQAHCCWPCWVPTGRSVEFAHRFRRDSSTYQGFRRGPRIAALSTRFDLPSVTIAAVGLLGLAVVGFLLRSDRSKASSNAAGWARWLLSWAWR